MHKLFLLTLCALLMSFSFNAQTLKPKDDVNKSSKKTNNLVLNDSAKTRNNKKNIKGSNKIATIDLYKAYDLENNVEYIDTSLTIQKEYKFNYLRKDNFGLLPFANIGQSYNQLSKDFLNTNLQPQFGARARHYNYMEVEDIKYYEVATPLTELFFKTAFKQGQLLDAFFTVNTSKEFNFSIAYKGLRSLGNYQNVLTSTGNLRFTTNFKTKNDKYSAKAHIATQDLFNQENGGLKDEDLSNFTSGDEDFLDRGVFDPNFENAENILVGKRFFLNHQYELLKPKDSSSHSLYIKNVISFEDKYFQFDQDISNDFFGESFNQSNLRDKVTLENFQTKFFINYKSPVFGDFDIGLVYNDINYGYDKVTILNTEQIPNRIKDKIISVEGSYYKQFGDFSLHSELGANVSGEFDSNYFLAEVNYNIKKGVKVKGNIGFNSNAPNFNLLLYQSDYINYNWYNVDDFMNQNNFNINFEFNSESLFDLSLEYVSIDNYSFFSLEENSIKPKQLEESINLYKIKIDKELKFGKFALDNSILYQKVNDNTESLNLPEIIARNTIYYSNHFFKNKALYLQTGITFNYFSDYFMDGYDPLLAEFYTQNQNKISGFPRLDFFVNAKIRQTRIFFKAEHFNSSFTGYNYFSAPNNPYRDFNIRFGLVWNFFL